MVVSALPRIAVTRKEAAQMLGVSIDVVKRARDEGRLHPKAVSHRSDGQVTKELYSVAELEQWFSELEDA
ncbi:helix-turn-helix domain-containing protein [Nocardioides stalactiti]|uniref:helix-turn-helix domain-containing protein n=1 Tax=Nocardioides stalactiti TaxID=2755356 RepID=UPI0016003F44|nr:helix-turn-helix domain-containing protein [Nocardioides stalactiti]